MLPCQQHPPPPPRASPPCYTQLQRLSQCRTAALRQVHLPQQPRSRASGYQTTRAIAAYTRPEAPQDAVGASPSTLWRSHQRTQPHLVTRKRDMTRSETGPNASTSCYIMSECYAHSNRSCFCASFCCSPGCRPSMRQSCSRIPRGGSSHLRTCRPQIQTRPPCEPRTGCTE